MTEPHKANGDEDEDEPDEPTKEKQGFRKRLARITRRPFLKRIERG